MTMRPPAVHTEAEVPSHTPGLREAARAVVRARQRDLGPWRLGLFLTAQLLAAPCGAQEDWRAEVTQLQPRIDKAIDRGVEWLLAHQQRDGSWGHHWQLYPTGQTALCAYTLLKCGLPPTHSALRRALNYLLDRRPGETYSAGCTLMAFQATKDPAYQPKMQKVLDDLLSWQDGTWSYPYEPEGASWGEHPFIRDLSNTQYAALGLRAAAAAGLKIKDQVWIELATGVLRNLERAETVEIPIEKGRTGAPRQEAAGFRYRAFGPYAGSSTGSMTAAGVAVLHMCKEALGNRAPGDLDSRITRGIDLGLNWLASCLEIAKNPRSDGWLYYWLYGLERVGSFREIDVLGKHPWYLEGARFLVDKQGGNGDWVQFSSEADTCFALLFLRRASAAPTTGGGPIRSGQHVHASEGPGHQVSMRGTGGSDGAPLALWITGFGRKVHADFAGKDEDPVPGLRVAKVEYLVDGEVVATVPGDPSRPWRSHDTYTGGCELTRRGVYAIGARVTLVLPGAPKAAQEPVAVVSAKGFSLDAKLVHEPWMDEATRAYGRNLLRRVDPVATASSTNSDGQTPARAVDGGEASCWMCKKDDKQPKLTLQWAAPIKANTLVLTQANGMPINRNKHDRITKVLVKVSGIPKPFECDLAADELEPTVIPLGGLVQASRLEITVLERATGTGWPGHCGFAEVALEKR